MVRPQIILFGDSLTDWSFDEDTSGFGWALEKYYGSRVEICNHGKAGFTSEWLKPDFAKIVRAASQPDAPQTLLFTIFLGANDACFSSRPVHVPLEAFRKNICHFVDEILVSSASSLSKTRIVLITPPPIDMHKPPQPESEEAAKAVKAAKLKSVGYRTYLSKKAYAEEIMKIAAEYAQVTDRVAGLNVWKALVDAALKDDGRNPEAEDAYDIERLPGCGLPESTAFSEGYFRDGLHFDKKGYNVITKELTDLMMTKWPELSIEYY